MSARNTAAARRKASAAFKSAALDQVDSAVLLRRLEKLTDTVQRKLLRAAIAAGLRAAVKGIKHEIPGTMKDARKAIGMTAKTKRGNVIAKVGGKVGKSRGGTRKDRGKKRPGVGLGYANIHWFLMGTADRQHKSGKHTGAMPAVPAVKRGWRQSEAAVSAKIQQSLSKGIAREAAKLAKGGAA